MSRLTDIELLDAILDEPGIPKDYERVFGEMRDRLLGNQKGVLTKKQREWATSVKEKYVVERDNSKVKRGKEVALPEVLRCLPLDPPGRRKFGVKNVA